MHTKLPKDLHLRDILNMHANSSERDSVCVCEERKHGYTVDCSSV